MIVVTSHANADFDTFASMVAVKKLYPEAHLVFSGGVEARLRGAISGARLPYEVERLRDIDIDGVTTLILVDCRQASRIGPFARLIGRPGVEVLVYDHHPATDEDVRGTIERVEPFGATTTVLVRVLKEKGVGITPEEATVMMAGIYEDTGSLSYPSTTLADFEAAAHLFSRGADLAVVSGFLRKELTPEEVSLLNGFLQSGAVYSICGAEVLIAEGYLERYAGDVSAIANKIVEIEGARSLFMLADSPDRVHIVARSRLPEVDAGAVMAALGGGGHAYAASATLKGVTLIQAKERLLAALRAVIKPRATAADIMSQPAITAGPETPIKEAVELMRRYNINAAPVVGEAGLLGVLTRQVADKAVYHGLGGAASADYMTTECEVVSPSTPVDEIREKVITRGARLLPVVAGTAVAGVITRTDLLKLLQDGLRREGAAQSRRPRMLGRLMRERLPKWAVEMLKEAGAVADGLGCKAYVVGGFVRDLLLRRANLDIDIVIEGAGADGIAFAEELARRHGARVKAHQRFKTAVVVFADGFKLDVATARLEYYEKPGALPTVERSSLKLDLYRRDFIINTLACALNPGRFGELIDFFGGQKDIKEKTIRVLHNLSFVEDPTRMLRAVRFSEKFGFRIGKHTLNLIRNSVKLDLFKKTSGVRIFEELKNLLEEDAASASIRTLNGLGILGLIHGGMTWGIEREAFFERARETLAWHELLYTEDRVEGWLVLFLALADTLTETGLAAFAKRLKLSGGKVAAVIDGRRDGIRALGMISAGLAPKDSGVYELLRPLPLEVTLYLMARAGKEGARKAISVYVSRSRHIRGELTGADLLKMGYSQGPKIGKALAAIFKGRCDGEITSRGEEEAVARRGLPRKPRAAGH
ncbi:MAG: CBS domain-containing protein [Deltaproteobacteria bacterium]|nr:CBS domain-containing protein [Deltaproteobacteria bacterium]